MSRELPPSCSGSGEPLASESVQAASAASCSGDLLPAPAESSTVCLGVMDDTCSHCAITRWRTIVFLSHFLRESRSSRVSEPKTTEIIICVMYDVFSSEDKSPDDLECLANVAAAALVLPFCFAPPPHCWIPDMAPGGLLTVLQLLAAASLLTVPKSKFLGC